MAEGPELSEEVYAELRRLAQQVRAGRAGVETIHPTDLLHEAWLKLSKPGSMYRSRGHFMAVAARAMRQILVDRARRRLAAKRGAGRVRTTVSGLSQDGGGLDILAIDAALDQLEAVDPSASDVFVARSIGGLTLEDTAAALGLSRSSVARKWRFSRAFVLAELGFEGDPSTPSC